MMVNTNSKLFLEILEQKGDDLYFNPDEFENTNVKKKLTQLQSEIKIPPIWAELSADDITALKKLKEEAKWLRALAYTEYEEDKPEKKFFQRKSKYEEKLDKHHEEKNKLMAIAESLDNRVDTMLFRLEIQSKANRTSTDANWNLLLDGRPMKYNDLKNTPELQSWYDRFRKNALEGTSALSWGDWKVSNAWLQWLVWWWALKAWYPEKNAKNLSNAASRALWIGIAYLRWTKTDGFRQKLAVGWVLFAALSKDYGDGRRMLNFWLDDSVINIDDLKMLWKSSNPDYSSPELTKRTSELQNEANQFKPLMKLFKDKDKLKEYLKNDWTNTSLDIKKLIENYGLNDKSNYANLDKTESTSSSSEKKTDWYDISDFNKDDPAIQALLVQLVHIYNTSQQDTYNISLDEFFKEIWVNSPEKVTELIEGTTSVEWLVNSKRASIEKEAIENQKKNIDQTLLWLWLTIKKGVNPAEVEKVINDSNFADLSSIMKIKKLEKVTELTKKPADIWSIEYTSAMKELELTSTLKDQVANKKAFISGFLEVKTLADYLYPRDKFILIQKDGELYIQHRWFKLKVEVDGASLYLKAKWRTSEFQLSWSSDPKVLTYDALIILNLLNSYKRKLDISDEKTKEVDTEFPFKGEGDKSLSFYQEASWLKENLLRVWWLIPIECEEESYLINNNLTWVTSSYKWSTKKLAAELNNLKDWSSKNRSIFRIWSDIPQSMVAEWVKLDWTYNSSTWIDGGFETNTTSWRHTWSRESIKKMVKWIPESIANWITGTVDYLVSAEPWKEWIVTKIVYTAWNTVTTLVEKWWKRAYETTKDASQKLITDLVTWVDRAKQNVLWRETNFDTYLKDKKNKPAWISDADYICKSIINFSATEPLFYSVYHNWKYQNEANKKSFWDIAWEMTYNAEYAPIISLLKNDWVILDKIKAKWYNISNLNWILQWQDDQNWAPPMLAQLCFKYLENNWPLVISEWLWSKLFGQLQWLMPENWFTRKWIVKAVVGWTMSWLWEVVTEIKNHPNGKSIIWLLELRLWSKVVRWIFN